MPAEILEETPTMCIPSLELLGPTGTCCEIVAICPASMEFISSDSRWSLAWLSWTDLTSSLLSTSCHEARYRQISTHPRKEVSHLFWSSRSPHGTQDIHVSVSVLPLRHPILITHPVTGCPTSKEATSSPRPLRFLQLSPSRTPAHDS